MCGSISDHSPKMKINYSKNRIGALLSLLASLLIPQQLLQAQITATWTGAGATDNWSTAENWDIPPILGDALLFSGSSRLVNNNDLNMETNAWLRFDSTGFVLNGNPLFLQQGITNSVGTNTIAMNLNWGAGVGQNVSVATNSELVIAGTLTNTLVNHTNTGGGRVRITGAYLQSVNPPATVLNNIEYVIDGGTFTSAGGVRIASGTTPSSSKMILTNGAVMTQTLSGGAVRVGDLTNIVGELIMHNSTFLHTGGEIGIGFSAGATGIVKQFGGVVSNVNLHVSRGANVTASYEMVGGVLAPLVIREQTGSGTSYISFDGSTLMPASGTTSNNMFFEGLNTAEIKSGGLTIDHGGFTNLAISQVFTGAGRITKVNSEAGILSLASASSYDGLTVQAGSAFINGNNTFPGGVILNAGTLQVGINANALGQSSLTLNGGTFRPNSGTRTVTIPVTIGGNVTLTTGTLIFTNSTFTLTGDRTLTVNNTVNLYSVIDEIGGSQALTKAGAGTLIIYNDNTYTGTTTINNGTVRVLNAAGSATGSGTVIVTDTGILTGTGQVAALSSVSGGKIAPGTGVGTLTITNTASFGAAGVYQVEVSDANPALAAGVGVDFLNIQGALDISATSGSPFVIDLSSMGGLAGNFYNTQSASWVIATAAGGITGFSADKFTVLTNNFQNDFGATAFSVSVSGNNLLLNFVATVTTPSTINPNIAGAGTTSATLSFSTVSGGNYTVQYKINLNQVGWIDLTNFTATASTSTATDNTDPVPAERYYRIVTP